MVDFIKRFGHVIAAIVIAWYAYSALDSGGSGLENKEKPLRIPHSSLPKRAEDEAFKVAGDPFFRKWAPYGPEYSPEAIAARKRAAQEKEEAEIRKKREARIKEREKARKTKAKSDREAGIADFQPFELVLESVLVLPGGGVARISGKTVSVGDKIAGLDEKHPPVLVAVKGTSATIDYRGVRIGLDVGTRPSHVVTSIPAPKKKPVPRRTADAGTGK